MKSQDQSVAYLLVLRCYRVLQPATQCNRTPIDKELCASHLPEVSSLSRPDITVMESSIYLVAGDGLLIQIASLFRKAFLDYIYEFSVEDIRPSSFWHCTMHHLLLIVSLLLRLNRASGDTLQNTSEVASSRMNVMLPLQSVPYPTQLHKQMSMPEANQMGNRFVGNWPQRTHLAPYQHFPPHLASPIVPIAVSFSLGFLLFRLLALGVLFLEKG